MKHKRVKRMIRIRVLFCAACMILPVLLFSSSCGKAGSGGVGGGGVPVSVVETAEKVKAEAVDGDLRYYTFTTDRPYRIEFSLSRADMDEAEKLLKQIDMEGANGTMGQLCGLSRGSQDFTLLYWRCIYNRVYNKSRAAIERLAGIFRRIKAEQGLNDVQMVYCIIRFVQFMQYDLPPGIGIYSPGRTLYEIGKGSLSEPPESSSIGWNGAGDCDTKSMLLTMLLQACGYRAVIFDSYRYQHAMAGVDCPGIDGTSITYRGVRYFLVETTYPNWNIGQMPQQFTDLNYFFPIDPREDVRQAMNVTKEVTSPAEGAIAGQGQSEREQNNDMASADTTQTLVIRGMLDANDPVDWYRLAGQEGTSAVFTLVHDPGMTVNFEVYNNGSAVASSSGGGNGSLSCQIPGQCHVRVIRVGGEGRYAVYISPGGAAEKEPNDAQESASTSQNMAVFGELQSDSDVDWYALRGQEGYNATYTIYCQEGSDVNFEIFNDGRSVGTGNSTRSVTAENPGRVSVKIWSSRGRGWYLFSIRRNR